MKVKDLKKVDIMITLQTDLGALMLGYGNHFKVGDIVQAIVITEKYSRENKEHEYRPGFFVQGTGHVPEIFCTTEITDKDYNKFHLYLNGQLVKAKLEEIDAKKEIDRLEKYIKHLNKKSRLTKSETL